MGCASVFTCEVAVVADFLIIRLEFLITYGAVGRLSKFCLLTFVRKFIYPLVYLHYFFQKYLSYFQSVSQQMLHTILTSV